jgi:hypothetical protein
VASPAEVAQAGRSSSFAGGNARLFLFPHASVRVQPANDRISHCT